MVKKTVSTVVMSFILVFCGQQLLAQKKLENNCWKSYVRSINHANGTLESVILTTDHAWDDYMQCAMGMTEN